MPAASEMDNIFQHMVAMSDSNGDGKVARQHSTEAECVLLFIDAEHRVGRQNIGTNERRANF